MNDITQLSPVHSFSYTEPTFPDQKKSDFPEITYMDFQQIMESDYETEWLVENFIEKGGHTLITGKTGEGKTMLTLNMALTLASDECPDLFGYPKLKSLKIAIIQGENTLPSLKDRISKLCAIKPEFKKGRKNIKLVLFDESHDNSKMSLAKDNLKEIVSNIKKDFNPDILIIDPYLRYSNVNENDNSKNRAIMDKLIAALNPLGITFIVVHHEGKGFQVSTGKSRGASSIVEAVWWHWTVSRKIVSSVPKKEELVLFCAKARDAERYRTIRLSITDGVYFSLPDNPYDPVKLVNILKANNGSFESQKNFIDAIRGQEDIKISMGKAREMIDSAVEKGFVSKEKYGQNKYRFSLPSS